MTLCRLLLAFALGFALSFASPAAAHGEQDRNQHHSAGTATSRVAVAAPKASAMPAAPGETAAVRNDRSRMTGIERLLDWLGRLHPIIVHFPIAFFPAALFTALVGRRRPVFAEPVRFLVVAGGITAPLAMVLGWFDGGLSLTDTDPLMRVHRWLGTGIGLSGLALAFWAWNRPWQGVRPAMMWALAFITAAIIVQGWYGGALVHGVDHMNW